MKVDYQMHYYDVITNPRWRMAANIKIVMACLSEKLSGYDNIWYTESHSKYDKEDLTKVQIFKFNMTHGRCWKTYIKHRFWPGFCAIFVKFCTKMQNLGIFTIECEKFQTFEIQNGGISLKYGDITIFKIAHDRHLDRHISANTIRF